MNANPTNGDLRTPLEHCERELQHARELLQKLNELATEWDALAADARQQGQQRLTAYPPGWWQGMEHTYDTAAAQLRELLGRDNA